MKIEYEETSKDLLTRIDIHAQFGSRDIDSWMLQVLDLQPGIKILDVACGAGKQCLAFHRHLEGQVEIVGGDVSQELLDRARAAAEEAGAKIRIMELDFNTRFPFDDAQFDLLSCCFAIYYAEDINHTAAEMQRVLKPGGRAFTTGPMPENKKLFYDLIHEATGLPIPPMPGSSRYASEILQAFRTHFDDVQVAIFENPLRFPDVEPFLSYTRASLSEDRKLWGDLFKGPQDFERVMGLIEKVARKRHARDGELVMTKVVGGFIATRA